jgi:hypothetical protein
MNSKVILVTDPDDIAYDGVRLLLVNLTADQTQFLVVIKHSIHTFDPQSINWPVKHDPFFGRR